MEVAVTTDVGTSQRFNDDAWCHEQLHRNVTLLALADGFGRPQGVPSAAIVLDAVRDVIRRELRRATFPPRSLTANDIRELLANAFAEGNDRLLEVGGATDDYVAAGSTCTLALIVSNQAFVANIGDSRAYLLRRGELVQLTSDESLLSEFVKSGTGQPSVTRNRQAPALLTRALGIERAPAVTPKIAHYTLHAHDAIFLCTDGVSRSLGFADLQGAVTSRDTARAAAERILMLARTAGSTDNATVILARNATIHGPQTEGTSLSAKPQWRWTALLAAALALFVMTGAIARAYWYGDSHLYIAEDAAGDVGLFAGSPSSLMGVPLHVERSSFGFAVTALTPSEQRAVENGVPVTTQQAADALVTRWQAQSRH
jgi:PPM family protein phosphatase